MNLFIIKNSPVRKTYFMLENKNTSHLYIINAKINSSLIDLKKYLKNRLATNIQSYFGYGNMFVS